LLRQVCGNSEARRRGGIGRARINELRKDDQGTKKSRGGARLGLLKISNGGHGKKEALWAYAIRGPKIKKNHAGLPSVGGSVVIGRANPGGIARGKGTGKKDGGIGRRLTHPVNETGHGGTREKARNSEIEVGALDHQALASSQEKQSLKFLGGERSPEPWRNRTKGKTLR